MYIFVSILNHIHYNILQKTVREFLNAPGIAEYPAGKKPKKYIIQ